jgi:membrane protein DedA with SNARE-associated domain
MPYIPARAGRSTAGQPRAGILLAGGAMHEIQHYITAYGSLALFVAIYLESMGAPLPGESLVIATSALAAHGDIELAPALAAIFCGAVLGDSTGYAIGTYGGRRLLARFGSFVGLTPERLTRLQKMFARRGFYIVASARFVMVLRQLNGLIAGSVHMPWPRFLVANAIGAALWTAAWGLGPYVVGQAAKPVIQHYKATHGKAESAPPPVVAVAIPAAEGPTSRRSLPG